MDLKLCEDPSIYKENQYTCLRDYFFRHSRSDFYRTCIFLNQCGLHTKIEDSENNPQTKESIKNVSFSLGAFLVFLIVLTLLISCIIRICLIRKMNRETRRFRTRNSHRNSISTNPEEEVIDQGPPTYADTVLSDDELPKYEDSIRSEPSSTRKADKANETHRHLD